MARQAKKQKTAGRGRRPKRRKAAPGATTKRSQASARADREPRAARLVVGLGASAGGLDAFKHFFAHMPPKSGMAFVLIQHLDPHHKSLLVDLLAKQTVMPVVQAAEGMAVVPDHVFVIPPNAVLTIKGGVLHLETPAQPRENRKPIDVFFASLAEDQGDNAVCIILSGSGSDGSLGLRAVKEHGGFTLAQAGFDETALLGMPSSAAATGLVDEVTAVERMPARLLAYQKHLTGVGTRKSPDGTRRDAAEHLTKIWALLRARLGHDFREYKESTLIRRIQRRMQVLQIEDVPTFIDRLRSDPNQLNLLFRDFLIGVTQFFRDPPAFAALESEAIPQLLANKRSGDQLRIWVPGCATGEEAYSIAMLVKEAMVELEVDPEVQIFASDLDDHAVTVARHGRYRKPLSGVSAARMHRWFTQEGPDYCVIKEIRQMCVFSKHNVIKDPPFAKLDLISCRNLLIYLASAPQTRLMRTFHYALRPGGYLFLGLSEAAARHGGLFKAIDQKHKLFRRRDDIPVSLPHGLPAGAAGGEPQPPHPVQTPLTARAADPVDLHIRRALEKYSPAYVVINEQHEVLRFSGRTRPYIEHSPGAASLNLFSITRRDLLPTVRSAVHEAIATRQPVLREDVVVGIDGQSKLVNLVVERVPADAEASVYVVAFLERGSFGGPGNSAGSDTADARVEALERELRSTRAQLQSTIDYLETTNEELKSSNEEFQSVNEELQSSTEELESSKEELQSMNEELQTVNGELASKNEALSEANSDIKNLLDSTEIATLFLDRDLRIRNFTPAISEIVPLLEGDRGRPITDFVMRLNYPDLPRDVRKVLSALAMIEHEVSIAEDGPSFLVRIRPYRTANDVIAGAVLTFVDVTERKRHQKERALLAAIVDSSQDAIIAHSLDGTITSWNAGAEKIFGYPHQEAIGKPLTILLPEHQADAVPRILERLARGERVEHFDIARLTKTGKQIQLSMTVSPVRNESGAMIGASTVARDISERKRADDLRALMMNELNHRVKNTLATVQSIAAQSLKGALDPASRETFAARLVALSRTHDLLARDGWESASLRDVVRQELEPYGSEGGDGGRFVIEGPDFQLRPKVAVSLGMAFHELAANAAKHGALSKPTGRVRVTWELVQSSEPSALRLRWAETGGPPVESTQRKGFGSIVIERGLSLEVDAKVQIHLDPKGLICEIEIPLRGRAERKPDA